MKRLLGAAAFLLVTVLPFAAHAEQILYLRDGSVLHGQVVSQQNGVVTFQTPNGTLQIPQANVDRIVDAGSAPSTPPPPPPTPPPGATATPAPAGPGYPGPEATRTPWPTATPERTPWPTATPAPSYGGGSAAGGAPSYGPPPSSPYYPPPRRPYVSKPLYLEAKLGYHTFTGPGWADMGAERYQFDGAALEGTMRIALQEDRDWRLDLAGDAGVYGGTDDCVQDGSGSCATLSFSSLYLDTGPRLTLNMEPFYIYGQAGVGVLSANETYSSNANGDSSESRGAFAGHVSGGLGLELDPLVFFGEVKWIGANAQFSDMSGPLGMGGVLVTFGAGIHF